MKAIVGVVHLFVGLCLCGSLLGSPRLLLGSLSTFVDRNECEWVEWSRPSSRINSWNGVGQVRTGRVRANGVRDFDSIRLWIVQCVGRIVDGVMAPMFDYGLWMVLWRRLDSFFTVCNIVNRFRARLGSIHYIYIIYVTYICYICNIYITIF
jgi:hypothetical protein